MESLYLDLQAKSYLPCLYILLRQNYLKIFKVCFSQISNLFQGVSILRNIFTSAAAASELLSTRSHILLVLTRCNQLDIFTETNKHPLCHMPYYIMEYLRYSRCIIVNFKNTSKLNVS